MKLDTAVKEFVEAYDQDAIASINRISNDYSMRIGEATIRAFNLNESFNLFCEFLEGYGDYKIKNRDNDNASPQDAIVKSVDAFIESRLFKECTITYPEINGFVKGYIEGIKHLTETVENTKEKMMDHDVELEYVGVVNDFADKFMDRLQESLNPTMNRFLWASGYMSEKVLSGKEASPYEKRQKVETDTTDFI